MLLAPAVLSQPVDLETAEMAAQAWSVRGETLGVPMGERIENSAVHETDTGAKFYTVKTRGGGTVIMTSDDELEPVLAFIEGDADFTTIDRESPLWAVLNRHVSEMGENLKLKLTTSSTAQSPNRTTASARWAKLIAEGEEIRKNGLPKMGVGGNKIGDMRVPILCKTKWAQASGIYNYYTPKHYACGCVATAQSQVMRKHCWPTNSLNKVTKTCGVGGVSTNLTTQGGVFDWANMPYSDIAEDFQKQAIGKLTSDVGICLGSRYNSGGTSAYTSPVRSSLRNNFGYAAAVYSSSLGKSSVRTAAMPRLFFANFDAGLPLVIGLTSHEIVADGYGYIDGVDYVHLNYGWGGMDNAWYHISDLTIDDLVYNIMPTNGMTEAVLSGRVLAKEGYPVRGATVKVKETKGGGRGEEWVATTTTSEYGVWAVVVPAGDSSSPKQYDAVVEAFGNYKRGENTGIELSHPAGSSISCSTLSHIANIGNSWGNDITVEMVNPDYPEVPNKGATFENHAVGDRQVFDEDDDGGIARETYLGKFWWGPDAASLVVVDSCSGREDGDHLSTTTTQNYNSNYASFTGLVYRTIHNAYDVTNTPAASAANFATEEVGSEGFVFDAMVRLESLGGLDGLESLGGVQPSTSNLQPPILPDDELKIAVVVKDGKLVVIAGDGVNDHSTKVYETGKAVNASKMHRLTIRASSGKDAAALWGQSALPGFRVWVDGRVIGDYPSRILEGENAGRVKAMGFLGTDTWVDDVFFLREVPPFILPGMMFIIR